MPDTEERGTSCADVSADFARGTDAPASECTDSDDGDGACGGAEGLSGAEGVGVFPFSVTGAAAFGARLCWFGAAAKTLACGDADTDTITGESAKCLKGLGAPAPDAESRITLPGVGVGVEVCGWWSALSLAPAPAASGTFEWALGLLEGAGADMALLADSANASICVAIGNGW